MAGPKRNSAAASERGPLGHNFPPGSLTELPWDRALALARQKLDDYLSLQAGVLRGEEPDSIHDVRVASRRLRQVLGILYPRPRPAKIRKTRRSLHRALRALSTVRNCDVVIEHVHRVLASKRRSQRAAWEAFRDYLNERRRASFRQASRRLARLGSSSLYIRAKDELDALSSARSGGIAMEKLSVQVAESLQEAWIKLEARVVESRKKHTTATLHAIRIACKRLRYRLEVLQELEVPTSDQAVDRLRGMQTRLGDWHDLEVMEEMMLELAGRPKYLREHLEVAMQIQRLVLHNRRVKGRRQQQLLDLFEEGGAYRELGSWVDHFLSASSRIPATP